jgi:hypothetical protein
MPSTLPVNCLWAVNASEVWFASADGKLSQFTISDAGVNWTHSNYSTTTTTISRYRGNCISSDGTSVAVVGDTSLSPWVLAGFNAGLTWDGGVPVGLSSLQYQAHGIESLFSTSDSIIAADSSNSTPFHLYTRTGWMTTTTLVTPSPSGVSAGWGLSSTDLWIATTGTKSGLVRIIGGQAGETIPLSGNTPIPTVNIITGSTTTDAVWALVDHTHVYRVFGDSGVVEVDPGAGVIVNGIWASPADNLWLAGAAPDGGGIVEQFAGSSVTTWSTPNPLQSLHGVSDTDVWVGDVHGAIFRSGP